MADECDKASEREQEWISAQLSEARYQFERTPARDIEADTCTGCQYATKSNWGGSCEAWLECRADIARKEAADKRGGK
jgi:hypothetical protein